MKKITWQDKVTIGAILAFVLINPLVGQYVVQGIILAYEQLLLVSDYVAMVAVGAILVALFSSKIERKNEYNAKLKGLKKSKKKMPAFID